MLLHNQRLECGSGIMVLVYGMDIQCHKERGDGLNFYIQATEKVVIIGDIYGDVDIALISPDEKYCVMAGCGIIVYYLKEPFENY